MEFGGYGKEAEQPTTPVWERLGEVLEYFFQASVLFTLFGLAVVTYLLSYLPMVGGIIAFGVSASLFFRILTTTAFGARSLDPPDFTDWGDVFGPAVKYVAASLIIIGALIWAGATLLGALAATDAQMTTVDLPDEMRGPLLLLLLGVLLFPLQLVSVALGCSFLEMFDPRRWFAMLRTMGVDYLFAVVLFYGIYVAEQLYFIPWLASVYIKVDLPVVAPIAFLFLSIFPWAFRARLLGAVCERYTERRPPLELPGASQIGARAGAAAAAPSPAVGTATAAPSAARGPDHATLLEAIRSGDQARAAELISDVLESLSRSDPAAAIALFREALTRFPKLAFSDRALAAVARVAERAQDSPATVRAAHCLMQQHPDSPLLAATLWTAAGAQEREGRSDLARKTLGLLVQMCPGDPIADQARNKLGQ